MYNTTIIMKDGSIITRIFDSYPTDRMIESSGVEWEHILLYEVNY